jgi:hypothetical protein
VFSPVDSPRIKTRTTRLCEDTPSSYDIKISQDTPARLRSLYCEPQATFKTPQNAAIPADLQDIDSGSYGFKMDPSTSADLRTRYGAASVRSSTLPSAQASSHSIRTSDLVLPTQYTLFSPDLFSFEPLQTIPARDFKISSRSTIFELDLVSFSSHCSPSTPSESPSIFGTKYKKVEKRTFPVSTTTPEEFRIERRRAPDPLANLKPLPVMAPPFASGQRYTTDRMQEQAIDPAGFMLPEEIRLAHWVLLENENALAWDESEKGSFSSEWFDPIYMPTVEHIPWVVKNIPIAPGIRAEVIKIIKDKIAAGTYEQSNSSYRSSWFTVPKKDGKSLRIVHDLQPLNKVSIRDAAVPPSMDQMADDFAGRACYGMLDLFIAFDQRSLDTRSRDLTTFQTPLGTFRLTSIPMGYTNSAQIMHGDVSWILQDEIPDFTIPYIDDCPVKGPASRYQLEDGSYEMVPGNPGVRRFVHEHLQVMHRIIHRVGVYGGTFSGKKSWLCVPVVELVGHICSFEGRIPDPKRIKVILDWPTPTSVTEVRSFLGTAGVMRVFIKGFASVARPLVKLTEKDATFEWFEDPHQISMDTLKDRFANLAALRPIDYICGRIVYLSIDSSYIAVGYILSQLGEDGRRYPARFGSIPWNKTEANYSQPKIELYGLFRALRDLRIHIIGVKNLVVEVDASSIKGMLNNPDLQPNAAINRWIAAIKTFDFTLVHIPGDKHKGPDGLSRRPPAPGEPLDTAEEADAWIDQTYGFFLGASSSSSKPLSPQPLRVPATVLAFLDFVPPDPFIDVILPPRDSKADAADDRVCLVELYLREPLTSLPFESRRLQGFLRYASEFFLFDDRIWRRGQEGAHQLVIMDKTRRASLLQQAHDSLGHKGKLATRQQLLRRFWWPHLDADVSWFDDTCLECQKRRVHHLMIPPVVARPAKLLSKLYCDTMHMPMAGRLKYIVHGRCSLTGWPEWRALATENADQIGRWLFEDVLCRWGLITEIVTDNGPQFIAAVRWLSLKYGIHHIRISPYNSRANLVERRHYDVREAIVKSAGGDVRNWHKYAHHVFWAERATIQKATGFSPFYMVYGVEPVLPFDIEEATWLVDLPGSDPISTTDLIATRA